MVGLHVNENRSLQCIEIDLFLFQSTTIWLDTPYTYYNDTIDNGMNLSVTKLHFVTRLPNSVVPNFRQIRPYRRFRIRIYECLISEALNSKI